MFGKEFYPTPKSVIRKMLEPYQYSGDRNITDRVILEPSAGKGDILDFIKDNYTQGYYRREFKPYCIEQHPELRFILQQKDYSVIAEDFLNYNGDHYFDLIVMNPPFSNGDEHLLKAWDILEEGEICCLLNTETIRNGYTERRKLLNKIIEKYGTAESLGNCFSVSERSTGVDVSLIRLKKKSESSRLNFTFTSVNKEKHEEINEETINNPVATRDTIGNMVLQYKKMKENYIEYLKVKDSLKFYSQGLFRDTYTLENALKENNGSNNQLYNSYCDTIKKQIWLNIADKTNMQKYLTNNVRKNFTKFMEAQGCMDFTIENVENFIKTIFANRLNILETAVVEVFDLFTDYHYENRMIIEGWKTNDKWKVNRWVILPYFVESKFSGTYGPASSRWDVYSDIEKVMCYLSGINYESIIKIEDYIKKTCYGDSSLQTSEFFNFRCYKKGTLHLEFKDKSLWQEFNMRACNGKNWLPESDRKNWEELKQKSNQTNYERNKIQLQLE